MRSAVRGRPLGDPQPVVHLGLGSAGEPGDEGADVAELGSIRESLSGNLRSHRCTVAERPERIRVIQEAVIASAAAE